MSVMRAIEARLSCRRSHSKYNSEPGQSNTHQPTDITHSHTPIRPLHAKPVHTAEPHTHT